MARRWIACMCIRMMLLAICTSHNNVRSDDEEMTCDFIIIGAGTTTLALAARLAESPWWTVCVFERGPMEHNMKSWYTNSYKYTSPHDPFFLTQPTMETLVSNGAHWKNANNDKRMIYIPRFRGLGGTSRVYGAINRRASPAVLESWPNGWKHDNIMKYYKKIEDHYCHYDSEDATGISKEECEEWHGKGGPMQVNSQLKEAFMEFPKQMEYICKDVTRPWNGYKDNYNGPLDDRTSCSVFQQFKLRTNYADEPTEHARKNRASKTARGSSYTGYYRDNKQKPYLALSATVTKILFDGNSKATGVMYLDGTTGQTKTAKALNEVILGGGSFDTPHLLQVSGVGPKNILKNIKVEVVAENEHVGMHLWDHISVPYVLNLTKAADDLCCISENSMIPQVDIDGTVHNTIDLASINGPFSWIIHHRSNISRSVSEMTDVQLYMMGNSSLFDELGPLCTDDTDKPTESDHVQSLEGTIRIIDQWPEYRGSVKSVTSNIFDKPEIEYGWSYMRDGVLTEEFKKVSQLFREQVKILRDMFFGPGVTDKLKKLVLGEVVPGEDVVTDDEFDAWIRGNAVSALHPIGTCKMPECADEFLRVKNVSGLRVCDASAFATQIDGNPAATLFAMAEKLADLLKFQYQKYIKVAVRKELSHPKGKLSASSTMVDLIKALLSDKCMDIQLQGEWVSTGRDTSALIFKWSLVCSHQTNERQVADLVSLTTLDFNKTSFCSGKEYPRFNRKEASVESKEYTAKHEESSFVFSVWCQGYRHVGAGDLWEKAGHWSGDRVVGNTSCFKLNCERRMCSILTYVNDDDREFIYSEPDLDLPGTDYVSTKKVVSTRIKSSEFYRTGSMISNPGADWYTEIAGYLFETVYSPSGYRLARQYPPLNKQPGWWTEISGGLLIYETNTKIHSQKDVAAFDLDGTIIKTKGGKPFPDDESDWVFTFDKVKPKLVENNNAEINNVVLTNQGGIGSGKQDKLQWMKKIEDITDVLGLPLYVLAATEYNNYRKPSVGMWDYYRCRLHQFETVNTTTAIYVGDNEDTDKKFAENAGIMFDSPDKYFA